MKKFAILAIAAILSFGATNATNMPQQRKATRTTTQKARTAKATTANSDAGKSAAELGKKYFDSENYGKAIVYVKKAAAQGDLDSQVRLADMTFFGNAVEMDREAAHNMLDKAIEKGSAYAMERKGFYLICEGMKEEGFEWFKKSCQRRQCRRLGVCDELLPHWRLRNYPTKCRRGCKILQTRCRPR